MPSVRIFSIFLFCFIFGISLIAQTNDHSPFIVVIDPGHGGKDKGTCGSKSIEKEITLKLATQLKDYLAIHSSNISTHLTRNDDRFINLNDRSGLANHLNADLFISIHCNHLHLPSVHGSEVYIMGLEKSAENIEIVKRENSSFFNDIHMPNEVLESDESHILLNMFQYNYLSESAEFANGIQEKMNVHTSIKQRGVKQAGFVVLKRAGMPGVLFESAYLSNPKNEAYLLSKTGQAQIAQALGEAIIEYFHAQKIKQQSPNNYTILLCQKEKHNQEPLEQKWAYVERFYQKTSSGLISYYTGHFTNFQEVERQHAFYLSQGFSDAKIILISEDSSEE